MADATCLECGAPLDLWERRFCRRCQAAFDAQAEADAAQDSRELEDEIRRGPWPR